MILWILGILGYWDIGILGYWDIVDIGILGILGYWGYWDIGILGYWDIGDIGILGILGYFKVNLSQILSPHAALSAPAKDKQTKEGRSHLEMALRPS